jgi:hypothetical protein
MRTGIAFDVGADVTGTKTRVEVQMPDRRVQAMFGSYHGGFLMLWMSDPEEIAEFASRLAQAGVELSDALASGRCQP